MLCTERQTKPRVLSAFFLTALLFAVVCGTARAAEITDLPDTLKADPMNGRWKERILPHQRLVTVTPSYEYWNVVFDYVNLTTKRQARRASSPPVTDVAEAPRRVIFTIIPSLPTCSPPL